MSITIRSIAKPDQVKVLDDDRLARLCLELAGGGWTTGQTRQAMTIQHRLVTNGHAIVGKLDITFEPNKEN